VPSIQEPVRPAGKQGRAYWLAGLLLAGALASVVLLPSVGQSKKKHVSETPPSAEPASAELDGIKRSIQALEQKNSVLQGALAAREAQVVGKPPAEAPESQPAEQVPQVPDHKAELERHKEELQELDVALASDQGDRRDRRAAAEVMRGELALATAGGAQIENVECATAFCKATIKEDTKDKPELDTGAIIEATPFLKVEAMFGYEREGSVKRTIVYAARNGFRLPRPEGMPQPTVQVVN